MWAKEGEAVGGTVVPADMHSRSSVGSPQEAPKQPKVRGSLTLKQASLPQVSQACRGSKYGQGQKVGWAGPCPRRRWA